MLFQSQVLNVEAQQFSGLPMRGVSRLPPTVVDARSRGISYTLPERWVVDTPAGQVGLAVNDWVVLWPNGEHGVFSPSRFAVFFERAGKPKPLKRVGWFRNFWRR